MTKSKIIIFISFLIVVVLGGVGILALTTGVFSQQDQADSQTNLPLVYTSTYPLYSLTSQLLEGVAEVKLVTTSGDVHDFEPSTRDITDIASSKVFIYNGAELDTWVDTFKPQLEQNGLKLINASSALNILEATEGHHHSHEDHSEEDGHENKEKEDDMSSKEDHENEDKGQDPHYWLSPFQMLQANAYLYNQLNGLDFDQDEVLKSNYDQLKSELENLDTDFRDRLGAEDPEICQTREILLSHNFMQYVSSDYSFELHTLVGNDPDGELSISETAELVEEIKAEKLEYLLQDGEVNQDLIEQIVEQTGVKTIDFVTMERVPENYQNTSYIQIQRDNLEKLETAMSCQN